MALALQKQSNDGLDQDSYYILASQNMKACQPWYIGSVVEPQRNGFNVDQDPVQNPDPKFLWPKIKKIDQAKKILFFYITMPPRRSSKLKEKPSALKREHPTLQNMKFLNFFSLFLWVIFALQDPDPLTWLNPVPIRFKIRNIGKQPSKS
jgi:hypothetical protein